jgi:RNA polymerase sigma factor (sigma-70 family)
LLRKESNQRVEAAIARLPESLRTIFVLGSVEGLRYRKIADILDCTEDAVKMRMHRARKRVRDTLKPYFN